jgi:hypothetical protein
MHTFQDNACDEDRHEKLNLKKMKIVYLYVMYISIFKYIFIVIYLYAYIFQDNASNDEDRHDRLNLKENENWKNLGKESQRRKENDGKLLYMCMYIYIYLTEELM